jgi:hypothetical protein
MPSVTVRRAREFSDSRTQYFANTRLRLFQQIGNDDPSVSGVAGRRMCNENSEFQEKAQISAYRTEFSNLQLTNNKGSIQM